MRIKRLEIQGFKSFKDKTVVHFDHAITGIVGPNGCGKSNIVDAVFWVMGEQSNKHIRAAGSQDLIFNGSSKHSPAAVAEVTLILEKNTVDLKTGPAGASISETPGKVTPVEISVTRRVYRDGEGEYLINGITARMRDIHELFMDTGVGAKGYSIIAQGEIHRIVNAKPEERRTLIEEAAGIAKYKARKREAERKLETAQGNLSRLQDVVNEVERATSSLEKQAQKASQYRSLKTDLTTKELTWGKRKLALLARRATSSTEIAQTSNSESTRLKAKLSELEMNTETLRLNDVELQPKVAELNENVQSLMSEKSKHESNLNLARARFSDSETRTLAYNSELSQVAEHIVENEQRKNLLLPELTNQEERLHSLSTEQTLFQEDVQSFKATLDQAQADLMSQQKSLLLHLNKRADVQSRVEKLKLSLDSLSREESQTRSRQEELLLEIDSLTHVTKTLSERIAQAQDSQTRANATRVENELGLALLQAEERDLAANLRVLQADLVKKQSRLGYLQTLLQSTENLSSGTRLVLQQNPLLQTLGQYLTVTPGYEKIVSTVLGDVLDSVALESFEQLESVFSTSRVSSSASFIFPPYGGSNTNTTPSSDEETLAQYVRIDESLASPIRAFLKCLFSNTLMSGSLEKIISSVQTHSNFNFATIDGIFVRPSGQVIYSGQDASKQETLLAYRNEVNSLNKELETSQILLSQQEESLTKLSEKIGIVRGNLEIASNEERMWKLEVESTQKTLEQDTQRLTKTMQSKVYLDTSLESILGRISETQAELLRADFDSESAMAEEAALNQKALELEQAARSASSAYTNAQNKMTESQGSYHSLVNSLNNLRTELKLIEQKQTALSSRKSEIQGAMERLTSETLTFSETAEASEIKLSSLSDELDQVKGDYAHYLGVVDKIRSELQDSFEKTKSLRNTLDKANSAYQDASLELERLDAEKSFLVKNLEEKHGPGCLEALLPNGEQIEMEDPLVTQEISEEEEKELNEEVEKLRERLRRLGDVNHNALEEYDTEKARLDHLTSEKKDLSDSIEDLLEAIEHINKSSVVRFETAFAAISSRFEKLFPIIFGGGHGKLTLSYPEGVTDIMEAGIEILAQPPGKKIVNMGLLSGGEKALTAVSFIFAIFLVKPSPFCILDEVDAPLDDANVGRFNALLREMSGKSQFIVITHNKKTMELNDALYGVTMEDPGVSKMVSIELTA